MKSNCRSRARRLPTPSVSFPMPNAAPSPDSAGPREPPVDAVPWGGVRGLLWHGPHAALGDDSILDQGCPSVPITPFDFANLPLALTHLWLPHTGGLLGSCCFLTLYPRPESALGCSNLDPFLPAGSSWSRKKNELSLQACPHLTLQEEIFSRAPGIARTFLMGRRYGKQT